MPRSKTSPTSHAPITPHAIILEAARVITEVTGCTCASDALVDDINELMMDNGRMYGYSSVIGKSRKRS